MGSSAKIDHDNDEHWTVCGNGCSIRLNEEPHIFGKGEVTKEATEKADGVMKFTCEVCGFSKEEVIPKLKDGHTHEYTAEVKAPTCASGGYTVHTCECGHTYTDTQTPAVKHNYVYKYTESEHWQECEYCHVATEKAAHKMGAWETSVKAGYTFEGEKQSKCKICKYAVKEAIPALDIPEGKLVITIPDYEKYVSTESAPSGETSSPDTSDGKSPITKELITKGTDNTVPALPTLPPTEDGNQFDGWVDKATGKPVEKGDKLTENIEIVPVWKDCGEEKHADADKDNRCDECGYIMVKEVTTEETSAGETTADTGHEEEKTPNDNSDAPNRMIIVVSCFGGIIAICGIVVAVVLKKKKQPAA